MPEHQLCLGRFIASDETSTAWVGCRAGCLSMVVSAPQDMGPGLAARYPSSLTKLPVHGPMQSYSARPERTPPSADS